MSPSESVKKNFPVCELVQLNSKLPVVVTVNDQDKTASDIIAVKEEEKKGQDSDLEESPRRGTSGTKRTTTISSKDDVLSWFKILCLVPAYDGKGRGLKFNDFNATDFQHVTFRHNGLHPRSYFISSWEFIVSCKIPRILSANGFYKKLRTMTGLAAGLPICNIIPIAVGMFYFLHWNACALYYFGSLKGFVGWSVVWPDIRDATLYEFYSWTFYQAVGNMFPTNFT
ncbi:hypothetical protein HDU79_000418, partial [Rhizoclosmatium sp. JEL0117]